MKEGRGRKDEGIRDDDLGEGKGDIDVDAGIVPALFVLRRVLGTLAVRFRSSFAVFLYPVRSRATERLHSVPL